MKKSLYEYCIERDEQRILYQWDKEKNEPLTPQDVSFATHKEVWWICDHGHQWSSPVYSRTSNKSGCPYCRGKRIWSNEHTLASTYPDIAKQWHPDKNHGLLPNQILPGTHRKAWWICENGHEWEAEIKSRVNGNNCPFCTNRKIIAGENDLQTTHPELAAQWHPEKNGVLTPQQVVSGSTRKVWWRCERGHEWKAGICRRAHYNTGCPYCTGKVIIVGETDLQTTHPGIVDQWHPTKNGILTPQKVVSGSMRKVWWLCERGHEWEARIHPRAHYNTGCPYCTGKLVITGETDLQTTHPEIAAQWHPSRNGSMTPQSVSSFSNRKAWWICDKGHEYQSVICFRTARQCGCPYCAGRMVLAGFNDLQTLEPKVAAQWHPSLNGSLTPEMVTTGSNKKVWWQCPEGHVWKTVVYARACKQKSGCPVCAGKYNRKKQYHYKNILLDKNSMPVSFSTEENDLYSK